jgi:predicted TIM-barrel fold metal-dependent hydrolase
MKAILATIALGALAALIVPLRRIRAAQQPKLDAATYAAMAEEAERIAAPFRLHVQTQLAALQLPRGEEFGGDFPDVEALLDRAGLVASW